MLQVYTADISVSILTEKLKKFRAWLQRDVKIEVFDFHKGVISEDDMKGIHIIGKLFGEDDQKTRKLMRFGKNSWTVTINPRFVNVLCPLKEKHVRQDLIKQENGQYLLTIQGVEIHE
jgi:hypothetical protein